MKKAKARYNAEAYKAVPAELLNFRALRPPLGRPEGYEVQGLLGKGKFSVVLLGLRVPSREKVAIKAYVTSTANNVRREVAILTLLRGGPNIQNLVELVQNPASNALCLVSDYYMFDPFEEYCAKMTPQDLRAYMLELLSALEFMHGKGVIHRDIKPQNVLYAFKSRKMKVIDFGQAEFYLPEGQLSPRVASRFFKAPELLMDYPFYNYAVDIWAAGVIFVSLIFGRYPFFLGTDAEDQLAKLIDWAGTEEFVKFQFAYLRVSEHKLASAKRRSFAELITPKNEALATPEALDLAAKMLAFDFSARISAKEALAHPFFKQSS